MSSRFNRTNAGRIGAALFLAAVAVLPVQAFAQSCTVGNTYYGELLRTADLDGNGTQEAVCNVYSAINVVSGTVATRYPLTNVYWTLANVIDINGSPGAEIVLKQGNHLTVITHATRKTTQYNIGATWEIGAFTDIDATAGNEVAITTPTQLRIVNARTGSITDRHIGTASRIATGAVSDMDGLPGTELPIEAGGSLFIYGRNTSLRSIRIASDANWKVCTDIANCASDMNGVAGAELLIAVPGAVKIYSLKSGTLSHYTLHGQYATLRDGVRNLDGAAGNDIALARGGDGNIIIIRPRSGDLRFINGYGTFGNYWELVNYANLDGIAGDEIRVRSLSNGRIYRVYPLTGAVRAE